jgi:hypothetical protein
MNRRLAVTGMTVLLAVVLAGLATIPWLPTSGRSVAAAIRNWFSRPPHANLLVTTDTDCDWKFDGRPRGRLRANESAKLETGFGQHLLEANTVDGKDEVRGVVELHKPEQQVAPIFLEPVRQARLDQEARQEAEARRIEAAKEAEARRAEAAITQKREWEAHGWQDPDTGRMWALQGSGEDVDSTQAEKYCKNLTVGGNSDWRLPAWDEVVDLYRLSGGGWLGHPRGPLQFGGGLWAYFSVWNGRPTIRVVEYRSDKVRPAAEGQKGRAFCVRTP